MAFTALLCIFLAIESRDFGTDLRVYRESVSAWSKGVNPYVVSYTDGLHFTYTPFALIVLWPLRLASFQITEWVLRLCTIAACSISTWLILRAQGQKEAGASWWRAIAWASAALLILEPARSGLTYGQVEALLMLAILVDALVIPAPYQGIVIGIVSAIKLTPLIFILFLLIRDWRSAMRAGASFVAMTALAWLIWPKESRSFWLLDVFKPGRVGGVSYAGNQSWFGVIHRAPFLHTSSVVPWLILCVMTVLIGTYVAWRSVQLGSSVHGLLAMALTGLLISPISWTHHWLWVLLIPPVLVTDRRPMHPTLRVMLWALAGLAVLAPYWWFSSGAVAGVLNDSLALLGFTSLSCWAVCLLDLGREQGVAVGVDHGSERPDQPLSRGGRRSHCPITQGTGSVIWSVTTEFSDAPQKLGLTVKPRTFGRFLRYVTGHESLLSCASGCHRGTSQFSGGSGHPR